MLQRQCEASKLSLCFLANLETAAPSLQVRRSSLLNSEELPQQSLLTNVAHPSFAAFSRVLLISLFYTRRRILDVQDDDLDQRIFLDDLNYSDACTIVIPVHLRISKFSLTP